MKRVDVVKRICFALNSWGQEYEKHQKNNFYDNVGYHDLFAGSASCIGYRFP